MELQLKDINDWNCQRENRNMDLLGEQAERVNVSCSVLEIEKREMGPCMHPFVRKIRTAKLGKKSIFFRQGKKSNTTM